MSRYISMSIAAMLCMSPLAKASTVAIIDSGVDIQHTDLTGKIWTNPSEKLNYKDDDGNGFVDDIHGWNFFANNNTIIDLSYDSLHSEDIERYFRVQDEYLKGKATNEDITWIQGKVADAAFLGTLEKYGTFVHGTHVAGISARNNDAAHILTIRLIPVDNPLAKFEKDLIEANREGKQLGIVKKALIKGTLTLLAKAQGQAFGQIGTYAGTSNADVANASLGLGVGQAKIIVAPLVKIALGEENAAVTEELAIYFLNQAVAAQKQIAINAPKTLFVFASGNDGTNNDVYPTSPANANLENTISVGASIDYKSIAPFSNYGKATVDLLAPGVGILSSTPNDRHIALSGTSQAAPFVTGVAAGMKDINPALTPADMKKIIIATVDVKPELKDKVLSSGIANRARAIRAAELAASVSIADAIAQARNEVADSVVSDDFINIDRIQPSPLGSAIISGI